MARPVNYLVELVTPERVYLYGPFDNRTMAERHGKPTDRQSITYAGETICVLTYRRNGES